MVRQRAQRIVERANQCPAKTLRQHGITKRLLRGAVAGCIHAGSGLTMLGSTAAGASAAGTVGIIGGTAGTIGAIGAFLMMPVTIVVGTVTVIGVGAYEGYCYFQIERVTDPYDVRRIIESIAVQDDAVEITSTEEGDAMLLTVKENTETYLLRDLYISDGNLMHRERGFDTNIGPVAFTEPTKD
jgi:hypothetical protein